MFGAIPGRLAAVLLAALVARGSVAAAGIPELPRLELANFDRLIREQVEAAYRGARGRPTDGAAAGRLGILLFLYQQLDAASVCLDRARALEPSEPKWVYFLGLTRSDLGDHAGAAAALQRVVAERPDYTAARLKLADSLLALGRLAESEAQYSRVVEREPGSAMAHYGLGRSKTARQDHAAAAASYAEACRLYPEFGSAHYALALAARDLGDARRAAEELQLYRKHTLGAPSRSDPWLDEAEAQRTGAFHVTKNAVALEAAGMVEASIAEHERAVALDPRYVQARANLVLLYGRAGRADKVEEHYRAAVALNPNLVEVHYNYGVFLVAQGRRADAAEAFRKAIAANPRHAESRGNLGYLLMTDGKLDEAEGEYRTALGDRPNLRNAHFNLGRILVHRGKMAEAIEHFEKIVETEDAETPSYLYALGAAHARLGNRDRALGYMRQAQQSARALGQKDVLASIERDLRALDAAGSRP